MTTKNIFRKYTPTHILAYALIVISTCMGGQMRMHAATQGMQVEDLSGQEQEYVKVWSADDFYIKHQGDPLFKENPSPERAVQAFLNHKYALLRTKKIWDLTIALAAILLIVGIAIACEQNSFLSRAYGYDTAANVILLLSGWLVNVYNDKCWRGFSRAKQTVAFQEGILQKGMKKILINAILSRVLLSVVLCIFAVASSYVYLIPAVVAFFSPPLGVLLLALIKTFILWKSHIVPLFNYWKDGKTTLQVVDPMEDVEILYIKNQHRLPPDMQTYIEKIFLKLRKQRSEHQAAWLAKIRDIISLPTEVEAMQPIEIKGKVDLGSMKHYGQDVQNYGKHIVHRFAKGRRGTHHMLLQGQAGVGKEHFVRLISAALGAKVAFVDFGGVSARELLGYPAENGRKGYIGRIAEAMIKVSEGGSQPIILVVKGLDIAFQSQYKDEINALSLDLFESNNKEFISPYLGGLNIPLPSRIIFIATETLPPHFENRLEKVHFEGYTWNKKREILFGTKSAPGKLRDYCHQVNLALEDLTSEDYQALERIVRTMEKEEEGLGEHDKDRGMNELEKRVVSYLLRKIVQEDRDKLKAVLKAREAKMPRIAAF